MPEVTENSQFLEVILAQVFDAACEHDSFDQEAVKRLKALVQAGDMTDYERIVEALKAQTGA